jgi:H+/gluconate symporter-like permease
MMATSGAAASVAGAIVGWLGVKRTVLVTVFACAVLTYGGVVLFVVIFTMYPLGIALMREANLPKRLFCGAAALGAGTFTMTALPGTPSIHNVIAASALGTDLFAGVLPGLAAAFVMFVAGLWYLEDQWRRAVRKGEGYISNARDKEMEKLAPCLEHAPGWGLSTLPLVVVLGTILVPRLTTGLGLVDDDTALIGPVFAFANAQPIVWPSLALVLGSVFCVAAFRSMRQRSLEALGAGANDSIMPLLNTAAVIGFGGRPDRRLRHLRPGCDGTGPAASGFRGPVGQRRFGYCRFGIRRAADLHANVRGELSRHGGRAAGTASRRHGCLRRS